QQVALADRLDDEGDVLAAALGARARGGEGAERGVAPGRQPRRGAVERRGEQPALVADRAREAARRVVRRAGHGDGGANGAAGASTVRSMCWGPWASDGNHASNCDGGA